MSGIVAKNYHGYHNYRHHHYHHHHHHHHHQYHHYHHHYQHNDHHHHHYYQYTITMNSNTSKILTFVMLLFSLNCRILRYQPTWPMSFTITYNIKIVTSLTSTNDPNITRVLTTMIFHSFPRTVNEWEFCSSARYAIQPNRSYALSKDFWSHKHGSIRFIP